MKMRLAFPRSAMLAAVTAPSCSITAAFTSSTTVRRSFHSGISHPNNNNNNNDDNMHTSHVSANTRLHQITPDGRADMDISFGSEHKQAGGLNDEKTEYGLYEDDVDEDQLDRQRRRETVQALIREQDEEFREQRRKKQWGKFANITNKEDLEPLLAEERSKIDQGM